MLAPWATAPLGDDGARVEFVFALDGEAAALEPAATKSARAAAAVAAPRPSRRFGELRRLFGIRGENRGNSSLLGLAMAQ
jgi:hypothetical protein